MNDMPEISDDELEAMLERRPSVREAKVADHELMVKALEHSIRRRMIKSIGVFGKKRSELQKEVGVNEAVFNFQVDFLIKGNYIKVDDDTFRLTDRGLVLLSNIPK
jgi:coproporphyrinogen III oxidase-like Fe-S oxidoreductase